jgi:hypothetical protein
MIQAGPTQQADEVQTRPAGPATLPRRQRRFPTPFRDEPAPFFAQIPNRLERNPHHSPSLRPVPNTSERVRRGQNNEFATCGLFKKADPMRRAELRKRPIRHRHDSAIPSHAKQEKGRPAEASRPSPYHYSYYLRVSYCLRAGLRTTTAVRTAHAVPYLRSRPAHGQSCRYR